MRLTALFTHPDFFSALKGSVAYVVIVLIAKFFLGLGAVLLAALLILSGLEHVIWFIWLMAVLSIGVYGLALLGLILWGVRLTPLLYMGLILPVWGRFGFMVGQIVGEVSDLPLRELMGLPLFWETLPTTLWMLLPVVLEPLGVVVVIHWMFSRFASLQRAAESDSPTQLIQKEL